MIPRSLLMVAAIALLCQKACGFLVNQPRIVLPSLSMTSDSSSDSPAFAASQVRFLGRGTHAIVRLGSVLLSPKEEFHHYLRRAAIFIYGMGTDENDVYVIRGVIVDHPTPFTMGEMTGQAAEGCGGLYDNLLFRGGDLGNDSAVVFHSDAKVAEEAGLKMIGASGIYQGGMDTALKHEDVDESKYKFFFNYVEFTEQELENMLDDPQDDGDAWTSVEVPPEVILETDYDRGEAWSKLRNAIRLQMQ